MDAAVSVRCFLHQRRPRRQSTRSRDRRRAHDDGRQEGEGRQEESRHAAGQPLHRRMSLWLPLVPCDTQLLPTLRELRLKRVARLLRVRQPLLDGLGRGAARACPAQHLAFGCLRGRETRIRCRELRRPSPPRPIAKPATVSLPRRQPASSIWIWPGRTLGRVIQRTTRYPGNQHTEYLR